jgi:hypothetical protein
LKKEWTRRNADVAIRRMEAKSGNSPAPGIRRVPIGQVGDFKHIPKRMTKLM